MVDEHWGGFVGGNWDGHAFSGSGMLNYHNSGLYKWGKE